MSSLILTSSLQAYVIISINLYRHALAGLMIQATCQRDEQKKKAPRIQELSCLINIVEYEIVLAFENVTYISLSGGSI